MAVELAVVLPLVITVAIVVFNLMAFLEASARFDRVAPGAVLAMGVSPAGSEGGTADAVRSVQAAIEHAMAGVWAVEVSVETQGAWEGSPNTNVGFSFAPHLTRYVCTLEYCQGGHSGF